MLQKGRITVINDLIASGLAFVLLLGHLMRRSLVYAQVPSSMEMDLGGPIDTSRPAEAINRVITIALVLGSVVAVVLIATGGYSIISSGGDPNKLKEGREQIMSAISGYILVLVATGAVKFVAGLLGI